MLVGSAEHVGSASAACMCRSSMGSVRARVGGGKIESKEHQQKGPVDFCYIPLPNLILAANLE